MDASAQHQIDDSKKGNTSWGSVVYNAFQNITDPFVLRQLFFIKTFSIIGFFAATILGLINISEKNYQVGVPDLLTGIVLLLKLDLLLPLTQIIS